MQTLAHAIAVSARPKLSGIEEAASILYDSYKIAKMRTRSVPYRSAGKLAGLHWQLRLTVHACSQDGASKKQKSKEAAPAAKKVGDEPTVDMLDIRVGQIISVKQHPNADSLYVEDIDLGEDKPRQVLTSNADVAI